MFSLPVWLENLTRQKRSHRCWSHTTKTENKRQKINSIFSIQKNETQKQNSRLSIRKNETQNIKQNFRKMRHKVNLRNEFQPGLDFSSAPQNVVFLCKDGEVIISSSEKVYRIYLGRGISYKRFKVNWAPGPNCLPPKSGKLGSGQLGLMFWAQLSEAQLFVGKII